MHVEFLRSAWRSPALGVGGILGLLVLGCSGVGDATGSEGTGQTREAVLSEMPLLTFPGIVSGSNPPDTIGEVGPNHFVQAVNATEFAVWDKTGTELVPPTSFGTLWPAASPCATDFTDPTVNYDHLADRWVLSQLPVVNSVCLAVSTTPVPTANPADWFLYEIQAPVFPDYQKIGVWPDAYYMTSYDMGSFNGGDEELYMFALDRAALLAGTAPSVIVCAASGSQCLFDTIPALGVWSGSSIVVRDTRVLPADLDGPAPPAGTPGLFVRTVDDQQDADNPVDRVQVWNATVDWTAQTWTVIAQGDITPDPFDIMVCNRNGGGFRSCIPQPDGTILDSLSNRPMMALRYRNFGDHASMVFTQTVNVQDEFPGVATLEVAGKRWYELRNTGADWFIQDQGDYTPQDSPANDAEFVHRWMGSVAMDQGGNIALGYNAVNGDAANPLNPSMFYTGRLATDPAGTMGAEHLIVESANPASVINNRWGDYTAMSVDPVDDCTFWYTAHVSGGETFVSSFRFSECGVTPLCILGETNVDLRDRVTVTADTGAGSFLQIGAPATIIGDGFSGGNALIRSNGVVTGDLLLGGTLSTQGAFTVGGTLTQNGDPNIPTLPTKTFPVGTGTQIITTNTTLAPGNRGDVTIRPGRTVTLNAGVYNFASLNIETDVNLVINGVVEINVQGNFQFGDRSDVLGTGEPTVYSNGGFVRLGTDATFRGILVAPNANVIVSSRTDIDGCVGGENVTFDTDVTLVSGGRTLPTSGSTTPDPPDPPTGTLTAVAAVTTDWGAGYCVELRVTNPTATATSTWSLGVNLNGSVINQSWNGTFSAFTGSITVGPGFPWNQSIAPGQTNNSVGFCANRPPGAGTAVVTSATGTF